MYTTVPDPECNMHMDCLADLLGLVIGFMISTRSNVQQPGQNGNWLTLCP